MQLDAELWAFWALLYWRKEAYSESLWFSGVTDDISDSPAVIMISSPLIHGKSRSIFDNFSSIKWAVTIREETDLRAQRNWQYLTIFLH